MRKLLYAPVLGALVFSSMYAGRRQTAGAATHDLLERLVNRKYLDLYALPEQEISPAEIESYRKDLEARRKADLARVERDEVDLKVQDDSARRSLEQLNKSASADTTEMGARRKKIHCEILKLEESLRDKRSERSAGVHFTYENRIAKLSVVQQWAGQRNGIERAVSAGHGRDRRHGDIDDIGIRRIGDGQSRDVEVGLAASHEMRNRGYLLTEVPDGPVRDYVQGLAQRIASNSDLKVPLHVTLLASDEVNAFGLPGGFLFVNSGLLRRAGSESELAGVLAHEIAHIAARHGYKLTRGISVKNVFSEGVQMAANVFTGGAVGTATQYAREYGIFGLGLALNLKVLGVNPECESEADQLAMQYLWRAGFEPNGFLQFYDRMASAGSSLQDASFFRTHPPYPEATMASFSELSYLPHGNARPASPDFEVAKSRLENLSAANVRPAAALEDLSACEELPVRSAR